MIYIKEIVPQKLSGRSSLLLKFDYNADVVQIIKQFFPSVFNKKQLTWEVSINYLGKLLDALTFYDDITLQLLPDEIQEISSTDLTESEIASFKYKPFDHQIEAINYGLSHDKWLLLDGCGLGKSLEMMYLAETLHNRGLLEHCLIICGVDSLRTNWKAEIQKFSNLDVVVLGEHITKTGNVTYKSVKERCEQLINPIKEFFIVVNIATIRSNDFINAFKKSKNKIDLICFDEAHRASSSSQQGSNLLKLNSTYKIAATGTLLTNSPLSAYLALSWTDNDKATLTNFKSQYCVFGGFGNNQIIKYKNLNLLKDELNYCSIRRTFGQVKSDMPPKTVEYELVEMSDEHQKFYEAIKDGVKAEANKVTLNSRNLLALTTRLRQATAAPSILTTNNIESSKVERAVEIAEDILENGEKVVIFSTFIEPTNVLCSKLQRFRPLLATGQIPDAQVQKNIELFRNSSDYNLIICTHSKAGTGYSMPECHYGIILDTPWTDASLTQSIDRIYRITSDSPVFLKILCCAGTIDERVRYIVEHKRDLSDFVIDDIENQLSDSLQREMSDIILNL